MTTVLLTNIDTPYRSPFYRALSKNLEGNLVILTCAKIEPDRSWEDFSQSGYTVKSLSGLRLNLKIKGSLKIIYLNLGIIRYVLDPSVTRIIVGDASLTSYLCLLMCILTRKSHFIWSEQAVRHGVKSIGDIIKSRLYCRCRGIIVPSQLSEDYIVRTLSLKSSIRKVHNAVPRSIMVDNRRSFRKCKDGLALIFVGQFIARKRIDLVFEVAKKYSTITEVDLKLIGGDLDQIPAQYMQNTANLNVSVFPYLPRDTVDEMVADADCLVLMSDYEPWGMVVNEALALGTKCIGSKHIAAIAELADDVTCFKIDETLCDLPSIETLKRDTDINQKLISVEQMADRFVSAIS